jgi:hypothetical protein
MPKIYSVANPYAIYNILFSNNAFTAGTGLAIIRVMNICLNVFLAGFMIIAVAWFVLICFTKTRY